MKYNTFSYRTFIVLIAIATCLSACFNDLDTIPIDEDVVTSAQVYEDPDAYRQVLAKIYAGLAVTGQQGPAGQGDIEGIDEGFGQYLRMLWYHQELTTEEAIVGWNDQTIQDFHDQSWTSSDGFIFAMYSRIYYQIPLCNEFLRETSPEKLADRDVDAALQTEIQGFRAEARFLRALSYWHALDLFRNVPFITEEDIVGQFFPEQTNANDLFNFIESELKAIENEIAPARTNEYARADQGAVWALLAKLYLNAEVYTGNARWADCLEYCEKIIGAGYTLDPEYSHLFLADNDKSNEIIFPIAFDGVSTRTWGGMTFIIRAGIGGAMNPDDSGVAGGWGGTRTTKELVNQFGELGGIISEPSVGNTVRYPKIYTPGSFQDFDFSNTNNALSSVNSDKIYEGFKYFPEENGEFLITQIPDESAPFFGDNDMDGTLDQFGARITVEEPGLYFIEVDLNDRTYELTKTEWGVIGDAVGGWEEDIDMEWDAESGAMRVVVPTVAGGLKFRANDDWAVNLGDNGADAVLDYDGENINMPAGEYEILLFLNRPDYTFQVKQAAFDNRAFFFSEGQTLDIVDVTSFTDGFAVNKFKNVTSTGAPGKDTDFPDTDFPVFRLADIYLMAAEAIVRNNGDLDQALDYFNRVRTRAFKSPGGNVTSLDLDLILDERARELYWECHRRTDLVRFGQFSDGDYRLTWKGGVAEGRPVEGFRDVFPVPASDIGANPNLRQNQGY
ncbi:MAG: RagB/SusD family nutrient uptake outer membrane protein [Bacteroidota bacterium]